MNIEATQAPPVHWTATLRWCPFWVALLLITLAFPTEFSFYIGMLRLTPYRIILLFSFIPCIMHLISGRAGQVTTIDWLIITHIIWSYIVIGYHHGGATAAQSGGIRMLEVAGAYMVARTYIKDERTYHGTISVTLLILTILAPFVIIESITGLHVIKEISSRIMGSGFSTSIDRRFGLTRAFGPFDHPILLGVFAASALGLVRIRSWPHLGLPKTSRRLPTLTIAATATASLSSGALAALIIQAGLLIWEKLTRKIAGRWRILSGVLFIVYMAVDTLSNRSGYHVFLHYLTFSAHTAYNRIIIFRHGMQDVWANPILGIGFNVWSKPSWMHSDSMDNFWLVQAVTFGLPGFFTVALAVILSLSACWADLPPRLTRLRMGWAISIIGLIVAACTVHFWNNLFVYFFFLIGAGSWFLQVRRIPPVTAQENHA